MDILGEGTWMMATSIIAAIEIIISRHDEVKLVVRIVTFVII